MLSYDTCCKLRDSGFPQEGTPTLVCYMYKPPGVYTWQPGWGSSYPSACPPVACPNADELIAAIQAKWPERFASWWMVLDYLMQEWEHPDWPFEKLPEALAALYCALAEARHEH